MRDEVIYFMDLAPMEPDGSGSVREDAALDEFGDPVMRQQLSGMVYAEVKSIGQNEFYQAQTADKKPQIKFVITDYMDYQGQKYLVHEGTRYSVLKTYRTRSNELEITCYGGVRDAAAAVSDEND